MIYLTDPNECRECSGVASQGSGSVTPLLSRILSIDELQRSGCQFGLVDLTPTEWMGLAALRTARARLAEKAREK